MRSLLKNIYVFLKTCSDRPFNWLLFKVKNVQYDVFPRINGKLMITGPGKLIIGNSTIINSSRLSNHIGEATKTVFKLVNQNSIVEIGSHTGISNSTFICREHIKIGDHVKIGGGVKFYDSDAHSLNYQERLDPENDIAVKKAITIKNHCFIGAYSFILKGVTIGEKSIIGAGSVVTKSIPEGEIWAGNPAKFIKKI